MEKQRRDQEFSLRDAKSCRKNSNANTDPKKEDWNGIAFIIYINFKREEFGYIWEEK